MCVSTSGRMREVLRQPAEVQQSVITGGKFENDTLKFGKNGGRQFNEAVLLIPAC